MTPSIIDSNNDLITYYWCRVHARQNWCRVGVFKLKFIKFNSIGRKTDAGRLAIYLT